MGDPAFDERKFAVGVPICRTRVLDDQSAAAAGPDVMRLPDGRLVQCVPAEYVLLARTISNSAAVDSWSMNIGTQAEHRVLTVTDCVPLWVCVKHNIIEGGGGRNHH